MAKAQRNEKWRNGGNKINMWRKRIINGVMAAISKIMAMKWQYQPAVA
jgi:hypothetical protein